MKKVKLACGRLGGGIMFGSDHDHNANDNGQRVNISGFGDPAVTNTKPEENGLSQEVSDHDDEKNHDDHGSKPQAPVRSTPIGHSDSNSKPPTVGNAHNLLSIKQEALQHLSPLIGHLDQEPEEKFRTTMMMIQASDDQSLVKEAYETAQKISNDKARAQALLDVINEINYFTQKHSA